MSPLLHAVPECVPAEALHARLSRFNELRLTPGAADLVPGEADLLAQEAFYIEGELAHVRDQARSAPTSPDDFVAWFSALESTGPGQHDRLFDYLAESATLDELRWFLTQEAAGEAGFDDLVALTQVKMPTRSKLEMARNYWDEMGRGHASAMHGPMLDRLVAGLDLAPRRDKTVWESLALANLMVALATRRSCAYRSAGALGVIELTAPGRAGKVNEGLRRLGVDGHVRQYFALHATVDVQHFAAWRDEILHVLVEQNCSLAQPLAEGALLRLTAGARCFARYRRELGLR